MAAGIMVMIKNIKLRLRRAIILCRYTPVNIRASIHLLMARLREIVLENRGNATFQPARDTDPDVNND
jgi:hypothetical protein